jgi:uncharacterized membrane protein
MAQRSYKQVAQAAAVSAVALLVSLGLCGATLLTHNDIFSMEPGLIGLLGIAASLCALVAIGLVALVIFLLNLRDRDKDKPQ